MRFHIWSPTLRMFHLFLYLLHISIAQFPPKPSSSLFLSFSPLPPQPPPLFLPVFPPGEREKSPVPSPRKSSRSSSQDSPEVREWLREWLRELDPELDAWRPEASADPSRKPLEVFEGWEALGYLRNMEALGKHKDAREMSWFLGGFGPIASAWRGYLGVSALRRSLGLNPEVGRGVCNCNTPWRKEPRPQKEKAARPGTLD